MKKMEALYKLGYAKGMLESLSMCRPLDLVDFDINEKPQKRLIDLSMRIEELSNNLLSSEGSEIEDETYSEASELADMVWDFVYDYCNYG